MVKLGRNEKCHCSSGKKYKKCCLAKDEMALRESKTDTQDLYKNGHPVLEETTQMHEYFTNEYPDYKVIDVSNVIKGKGSYKTLLTKHYYDHTILLATRNEQNDRIFQERGDRMSNWMVMFRGAHQVFNKFQFEKMKSQLKTMIKRRLNEENYAF